MSDIQCYLAQYTANLLRRETTNVGLILQRGDEIVARFFGELFTSTALKVDTKTASKRVVHPGIYRQWVQYWRYQIGMGVAGLRELLNEQQGNFSIVPTASVSGLSGGTLRSLLDDLFGMMVDSETDTRPTHQPPESELFHLIRNEFKQIGILAGKTQQLAPRPVVARTKVQGKRVEHQVSFAQKTDRIVVMQTITIAPSQSKRMIGMSAQSAAYMFDDICEMQPGARPIAIVRTAFDPIENKEVERAFNILQGASEVVNWADDTQRASFVDSTFKAAFTVV